MYLGSLALVFSLRSCTQPNWKQKLNLFPQMECCFVVKGYHITPFFQYEWSESHQQNRWRVSLKVNLLLSWWLKYQQERLRDCVLVSAYPAVFTIALSLFNSLDQPRWITRMLEFRYFLPSIKMDFSLDSPFFARNVRGSCSKMTYLQEDC